ncbi:MAG: DUF3124 domain-containing protein [Planctomycetaceae bacterium]
MTIKNDDKNLDKLMRPFLLIIFLSIVVLFSPLVFYAWVLDSRMQDVQNTLRYQPSQELETSAETPSLTGHYILTGSSRGQLVYVPAYSHIYHGKGEPHLLAVTLSIRNTSIDSAMHLRSIRYFDTQGNEVKSYLQKPQKLPPLATTEFLVEREDTSGGSGANFLVEWFAEQPVSQPVLEAIMIDTNSQQGISFARVGTVIAELNPEESPDSETPPAESK